MISLTFLSLALSLIGLLVFEWYEETLWFVLGVGKALLDNNLSRLFVCNDFLGLPFLREK